MTDSQKTPNPGSPEAVSKGCRCPVLDNANGRGYMGVEGIFVYTSCCPLHWPAGTELGQFAAKEGE
jgi:hypothetical protein